MRAPLEVRFDKLEKIIQCLHDESQRESVIIVEGLRDKLALRSLGIQGKIECIQSSRKSMISFAEQLGGEKKVIILTDFDRQGVFLAHRLSRNLSSQRIPVNMQIWRDLRGVTRSEARSVQELGKLYERLQTDVLARRSRNVVERRDRS